MLRKDVPFFQIANFSKFDKGAQVKQLLQGEFIFRPGDFVQWEAGCNISGYADVVSAEPPAHGWTWVTLQKMS
ncbi:hypothetical protein EPO17_02720 [Patescibacteria group bacterium]|nr:MAG: hypothetical protein EPO17_02720 [Patescibacteria group bacterium]